MRFWLLLKNTYDSQRYSLEDNIVVRFPKLIKAATEKAEYVREDMKTVEKNFIGVNYLVLRGKTDHKAELSSSPAGNMVKLENLLGGMAEDVDLVGQEKEEQSRVAEGDSYRTAQ